MSLRDRSFRRRDDCSLRRLRGLSRLLGLSSGRFLLSLGRRDYRLRLARPDENQRTPQGHHETDREGEDEFYQTGTYHACSPLLQKRRNQPKRCAD